MKMQIKIESPMPQIPHSLALVDALEIRDKSTDRSWFRNFLHTLFSSPDLDLSQFERLETKRTPQQMRRE
ncbi:hypothetical protein ACSLVQ_29300, partial [Klebsiella pneumoniae]|uniref:hypothetical protein n=1 Tax=Klebsiella pneumoniae TaxID=573 RepID=UPI003EDFA495